MKISSQNRAGSFSKAGYGLRSNSTRASRDTRDGTVNGSRFLMSGIFMAFVAGEAEQLQKAPGPSSDESRTSSAPLGSRAPGAAGRGAAVFPALAADSADALREHRLPGCRGRIAKQGKHFLTVTRAQRPVAYRGKMEAGGRDRGATGRRNDAGRRNGFRQFIDDFVHARAGPILVGIHDFAGQQRHLVRLEIQVLEQMVVYPFDFVRPLPVTRVGLAL